MDPIGQLEDKADGSDGGWEKAEAKVQCNAKEAYHAERTAEASYWE